MELSPHLEPAKPRGHVAGRADGRRSRVDIGSARLGRGPAARSRYDRGLVRAEPLAAHETARGEQADGARGRILGRAVRVHIDPRAGGFPTTSGPPAASETPKA